MGHTIQQAHKIAKKYGVVVEKVKSNDGFNPNQIADIIQGDKTIIFCAEDFYCYKDGCYQSQSIEIMKRCIKDILGKTFSKSRANEVIHSLKDRLLY